MNISLSLSMNTSTENVVEVNDVTQLQIIHYFPVTVFMLRSIAAVLWGRRQHRNTRYHTYRRPRLWSECLEQTAHRHSENIQTPHGKTLGQNQTPVLTTALPRQPQCEIIPLKGSCSYTRYTLGVTAEDGSAMRSSIRGMAQFGTGWNWQAGEEDQKRRFMDVDSC